MNKKINKLMAIFSLLILLITSLPLQAFATFITDINSNAQFGVISGSYATYGHELHYANYDGATYMLFCTQHGIKSPTGRVYAYGDEFLAQYKANRPEYERIAEMIYFGYAMNYGMGLPGSYEAQKAAACTQQYVWEQLGVSPGRDSWNGSYMSSGIYASWLAQTEVYYNQYHSNVSFRGTTATVVIGDEISLNDTNGVLQHYPAFSQVVNGVTFRHDSNSNSLIISVPANSDTRNATFNSASQGIYELMPNGATYSRAIMSNYVCVEFHDSNVQNLMFSNYVDPSTFSVSIRVQSGTIKLTKRDSETGSTTQGDAKFTDAKYGIYAYEDIYNPARTKKFYSKGDLVATRTMNENGLTSDVTKLPIGKYVVKELVASTGYLLDENEYIVDLTTIGATDTVYTKSITSNEKVKKMKVNIFKSGIKVNSGETPGLEGAEFTIKLYSDVQKAYDAGYTYEEVWRGVNRNGDKVEVDETRVTQAQQIAPSYSVIVTGEDGNAYADYLPYGKYLVKETNTPKDYETATDFTFSISDDESEIDDIAKKVKHIVVNNEQLETYIKLVKKDLKTSKNVSLNNATFQIKATEDIYDRATGKILYKKGEAVTQKIGSTTYNSFTTNAENIVIPDKSYTNDKEPFGTIITPLKLEVGSYEVTEIKIPDGFLQLDNPVQFKVEGIRNYDTDPDGDFIKEVIIKNEQPTGTLIINKTVALRDNIDTSIVDISDLSGIEFKLIAKENIIDYSDGSYFYNEGDIIGTYNLDKQGNLKIEELPMGVYELEEIKTVDGLVLNDTKYEIKFEKEDDVTKVYEVTQDISNDTTVFEFSKTDITGDKELEGAKLTVFDENDQVIDTWTSTEKTHKIEGLVVGKTYTLREELAPEPFAIATDIKFEVYNTSEIQNVKMIDKLVEIVKTDLVTGEEIEGAELKVVDEDNNIIDEWTSTKEPHTVAGLQEGKKYKLIETTAPYGYEITEEIEFKVTQDKNTQRVEMKDMPILKDIKLIKIDSNTKDIIKLDFTFGIYEDEECTKLIREIHSDKESGTVLFDDLRYGTYYIKEIEAPKGYMKSDAVTKIEINDKGVFINYKLVEANENGEYCFEFENVKIETPNTGDESKMRILLGILILSTISLIGYEIHRRKNKKNKISE